MRIDSSTKSTIDANMRAKQVTLEKGDIIKGEVVAANNNGAIIKNASGQLINASFGSNINLNPGQSVTLQVCDLALDKVFVELKSSNSNCISVSEKLKLALEELGFAITHENINIAKFFLKNGLPLNREAITKALHLKNSLSSFQNITLEKMLGLMCIGNKVNDISIDELSKMLFIMQDNLKNLGFESKNIYKVQNLKSALLDAVKELGIDADKNVQALIDNSVEVIDNINSSNMKDILSLFSNGIMVTPRNLKGILNNINGHMNIGNLINDLIDKLGSTGKNIDSHSDIRERLRKYFFDINRTEDNIKAADMMVDLLNDCENIERSLNKDGVSLEIGKLINDIKDELEFIKSVNEHNIYMHLPILSNEQSSSADIYILGHKDKLKKIDKNNATILLSLELSNIGHIESMINVIEKKIDITFRTNDDLVRDLLNKNLISLSGLLDAQGYSLCGFKITNIDERFNLNTVMSFTDKDIPQSLHFDLKI